MLVYVLVYFALQELYVVGLGALMKLLIDGRCAQ